MALPYMAQGEIAPFKSQPAVPTRRRLWTIRLARLEVCCHEVIVVGTGTVGTALRELLEKHGDEVVSVGRKSGDMQADMIDPAGLSALFASAAGDVFPGRLEQTTDDQWAESIRSKGMGQINVVRSALPDISDGGSFALISGVLTDEYLRGGTIGTTVNHMVEGFVKGAAVELPRGIRTNCVSPTVLAESVAYHETFAGFTPIAATEVALAYLRAIVTPMTGRILKLHKTNC
ncbi:short chain dehydrogenase [Rhizobium mongolense]|uniref:short chain dehydrogenase n=1 Tax=Rhizobium mongolense TaxID=57676 RepID=UPI0035574675